MEDYHFEPCHESGFYYDYSDITSIEKPFNALKMSFYLQNKNNMSMPDNIYFDVEFLKENLDLVKNVKYITFGQCTRIDEKFYDYLETCNHFHVGFSTSNFGLNNGEMSFLQCCHPEYLPKRDLKLSNSVKSLLLEGIPVKIVADNLENLYLGCAEDLELNCGQLEQLIPYTVKKLYIGGFAYDKLSIKQIEEVTILVEMYDVFVLKDQFSDTIKRINIVINQWNVNSRTGYTLYVSESLKNTVFINHFDNVNYKIEWVSYDSQ